MRIINLMTHVRRSHPQPFVSARILLRESYRDGGKVRTRTIANLTDWPDA
jgi:hypothetical protein